MSTIAENQSGPRITVWQASIAAFALGVVALLVVFWPTFAAMERTWRSSDTFQHSYVIPFVLAYLVWETRYKLADLVPETSWWGLLAMLGASLGWLAGNVGGVLLVEELAVIGMIQGLALAVFGWKVVRAMLFPLAFMIFLVPIGEFMVPILQQWTAAFSVWSLELIGLPVTTDGLYIYVDGGTTDYSRFHVAKECSGIRYLTAMLQVGLLVGYLFFNRWPRRVIAVVVAVIVPIVANWLRALGIILTVYYTEGEHGKDVDHLIYGFWFFLFVLLVYLGICWLFADPLEDDTERTDLPRAPLGTAGVRALVVAGILGTAAIAAGPLYAAYTEPHSYASPSAVSAPVAPSGWRRSDYSGIDWAPRFRGADGELHQLYVSTPERVDLFVGFYTHQRQGAELVNSANDLAGENWDKRGARRFTLTIDGNEYSVPVVRIIQPASRIGTERQRAVAFWYWIDGRIVTDDRAAKIAAVRARLFGGEQASAVFAVATDFTGDMDSARADLQKFISDVRPMQAVAGVETP